MWEMNQPPVTMLMSVYNGARFLREAVDSILAQTMPDFEFLIVDDGSIDETSAILSSYTDPRIRVVRQENQGLAAALNRGLHLAHTELVARMDADDIALPERLEVQLAEYDRLGHPDVMGTAIEVISETGHSVGTRRFPEDHESIIRNLINGGPTLAHPTVLYRKEAVLACGGYDPAFRTTQDYDLWLRMLPKSQFANSPQCLLRYRLRADSNARALSGVPDLSPAFLHCVAKQRYLLASNGCQAAWDNELVHQRVVSELTRRYQRAGTSPAFVVSRELQIARVELLSPDLRIRGTWRALKCLATAPFATLHYALTHRIPEPQYLTAEELSCIP